MEVLSISNKTRKQDIFRISKSTVKCFSFSNKEFLIFENIFADRKNKRTPIELNKINQ